ncbi:Nuclear cap-binding protein subunit 1 [Neolecta irregularis DAH-3]|uniref:Nuclear cap-binding protein subunit 1 n=1 Tax=Neolecta irregularis (strain DAH-3) TaxID=1198029 RepID=A0A1U7LI97_NEOID|nr:Nuclear cap-binding protein subunit 1 [Neolecta irregularis DAH-3]|eukprot:OLL22272.1 Nuclear cap-binding protein subunit 1 [Neolecta irregularis DAH-3]
MRDILLDTIDIFEVNRKDAAKVFADLDVYFPQDLFAPRGTPVDKLQSPDISSTWKQEDTVVEAIFARLFKLPNPPHREVYYHSLLMELCMVAPKALAPSFGRAIRAIYSKLAITDGEVAYRFYDWFTHHLSNFGFSWKWNEWTGDIALPESHPRRVFIREVLEKELRLSYHGRIQGTIPEEYQFLIGDEPPSTNFKYANEDEELYPEASALLESMRQKKDQSEILQQLVHIETRAREEGLENPEFESLEILVQIVLYLGEMSFSHALNNIERNLQPLIQKCNANQQARRHTISVVMDFWKFQPSIGAILLDKLLNYTVLTPLSVIEWLLVDSTFADRAFAWEISFKTIDKVNARVTRLSTQVSNLETQEMQNEPQREHFERAKKTLAGTQAEQKEVFIMLVEKFPGLIEKLKEKDDSEMSTEDGGPWGEWWGKQWMKVIFRRVMPMPEVGELAVPLKELAIKKGSPDYLREVLEQVAVLSR